MSKVTDTDRLAALLTEAMRDFYADRDGSYAHITLDPEYDAQHLAARLTAAGVTIAQPAGLDIDRLAALIRPHQYSQSLGICACGVHLGSQIDVQARHIAAALAAALGDTAEEKA